MCLTLNKKLHKRTGNKRAKPEKEKQEWTCRPIVQKWTRLLEEHLLMKQKLQGLEEDSKGVFLRLLPHEVNTRSMKDESLEVELQQQQAEKEYPDTYRNFKSNQKKKVNNLSRPISAETADQGWKDTPKNHQQKDRNVQNLQKVRTPEDRWKCP